MLNCRCSCRSLQGDPGMAGPTSAPRRRAAPLLWLEDRRAPCHRVRVPEPEGARDVDSGSVAPAQYRQREEAPHLRNAAWTILTQDPDKNACEANSISPFVKSAREDNEINHNGYFLLEVFGGIIHILKQERRKKRLWLAQSLTATKQVKSVERYYVWIKPKCLLVTDWLLCLTLLFHELGSGLRINMVTFESHKCIKLCHYLID